jgi:hypothetical protein
MAKNVYENLTLVRPAATSRPVATSDPTLASPQGPTTSEEGLLTEVSHQTVVYYSPEAYKAISRYALEQSGHRNKMKLHDLWILAMQEFCDRKGLNVTVRAKSKGRPE